MSRLPDDQFSILIHKENALSDFEFKAFPDRFSECDLEFSRNSPDVQNLLRHLTFPPFPIYMRIFIYLPSTIYDT